MPFTPQKKAQFKNISLNAPSLKNNIRMTDDWESSIVTNNITNPTPMSRETI